MLPGHRRPARLIEEDPDILFKIEPSELNLSTTLPAE
jgi:hypothetical protein